MSNEGSQSTNGKNSCDVLLRKAFKAYKAEVLGFQRKIDNLVSQTQEKVRCQKCEELQKSLNELQNELKEQAAEKDKIILELKEKLKEYCAPKLQDSNPPRRVRETRRRIHSNEDTSQFPTEQNATKRTKLFTTKSLNSPCDSNKPGTKTNIIIPETLGMEVPDKILVPETLDIETNVGAAIKIVIPETLGIHTDIGLPTILVPDTLAISESEVVIVDFPKGSPNKNILKKLPDVNVTDKSTSSLKVATSFEKSSCSRDQTVPGKTKQSSHIASKKISNELANSVGSSDRDDAYLSDNGDFDVTRFKLPKGRKVPTPENPLLPGNLRNMAKKSIKHELHVERKKPKKPGQKSPKFIQTKINKEIFTRKKLPLDKDLEIAITESLKDAKMSPEIFEEDLKLILPQPGSSRSGDRSPITVLSDDCSSNDSEDLLAEIGAPSPKKKKAKTVILEVKIADKADPSSTNHLGYYDRLPEKEGPAYKYKGETIRRKEERAKLNGQNCVECSKYNEALPDNQKGKQLEKCSRHRDAYEAPSTPLHFWSPNFPSTPECLERGYQNCTTEPPLP